MKSVLGKIFFILSMGCLNGCYYDIDEELYGTGGPCDASNVTYAVTVSGILQQYGCKGCHSGVSASGGVRLDNFNDVKTQIANGRLWGSINHSSGFSPMPKGGNKMLSCDINKIKAWIDAGSPDN
jgi:hypothetical protein